MEPGLPSRTALGAAAHRAVHQELEGGRILRDPLALRILGPEAQAALREARSDPSVRPLRLFIAVRTRFAQDALADALAHGVRQLVILGAGLDTHAYRAPPAQGLHIFEVDHPATQAWKRERLAQAAIAVPATLTFVPIDFERQALPQALATAGFDFALPTFFTWLGVVPYLTPQAVFATLEFIAKLPAGAHVVFDYANPPDPACADEQIRAVREALEARVASLGEAFRSRFETSQLLARLRALGFCELEDLGPVVIRQRYFASREGPASDRGGHIVRAATAGGR
ncbi:Methyltransferase [Burkholderiales bacterium]|nr:Methyltransferase [Burkholderiales bacterium]